MPDIVLIARGSPDPRHAEGVEHLADAVRARVRLGRAVGACYLDHHGPTPSDIAAELNRAVIAVPVLLAPGAHTSIDLPTAPRDLAHSGARVRLAAALGPDPRLFDACDELLRASGETPDPGTAVVVYCAGSDDEAAVQAIADLMATVSRPGWGRWSLAALKGGDAVEAVVARLQGESARVVAVPMVVAEGAFHDEMRRRCRDLDVALVPGTLADTEALADLVVARTNGA